MDFSHLLRYTRFTGWQLVKVMEMITEWEYPYESALQVWENIKEAFTGGKVTNITVEHGQQVLNCLSEWYTTNVWKECVVQRAVVTVEMIEFLVYECGFVIVPESNYLPEMIMSTTECQGKGLLFGLVENGIMDINQKLPPNEWHCATMLELLVHDFEESYSYTEDIGEESAQELVWMLDHGATASSMVHSCYSLGVMRVVLEHGVDVNSVNSKGNSVLMSQISHLNEEIFNLLLDSGADISHKNKKGLDVVSILRGIKPFHCSNYSITSLFQKKWRMIKRIRLLVKYGRRWQLRVHQRWFTECLESIQCNPDFGIRHIRRAIKWDSKQTLEEVLAMLRENPLASPGALVKERATSLVSRLKANILDNLSV